MRRIGLAVVLLLALGAWKCSQPLEMTARDSIAAASGFLKEAQKNHVLECSATPQCSTPNVQDKGKCVRICESINRAIDAQTVAINALSAYCASDDWDKGGACKPKADLAPKLKQALSDLDATIAAAKGLVNP